MHCIVYLQRATLDADVRRPSFPHQWIEYPETGAAEQLERLRPATIAISNKLALPRAVLEQLPRLQLVATAATGTNHIDLDYCRGRGIRVCNVPDYSRHTLPEHVFMLLLALRRHLFEYRAAAVGHDWRAASNFFVAGPEIRDLHGSTLGIVGRGSLGGAVAALASAFGMHVAFAERKGAHALRPGYSAFDEVLRTADAVTLHCPLTAGTGNLIGARELGLMQPGAVLINTARGALLDEAALVDALRRGVIAGAGIDVLAEEPPRNGSPLLDSSVPNLIVTPHVAWASTQARQRLADGLIDNIEAFVAGRPTNLVM